MWLTAKAAGEFAGTSELALGLSGGDIKRTRAQTKSVDNEGDGEIQVAENPNIT